MGGPFLTCMYFEKPEIVNYGKIKTGLKSENNIGSGRKCVGTSNF